MSTIKRNDTKIRSVAASTSAASTRVDQINAQLASAVAPALRGDVPELGEIQGIYRSVSAGLRGCAATLDGGAGNLRAYASLSALSEARNLALLAGISDPDGRGRASATGRGSNAVFGGVVDFLRWSQFLPSGGGKFDVGTWLTGTSISSVGASIDYVTKIKYGSFQAVKFRPPWAKGFARSRIPISHSSLSPFEKAFRHGFASQYRADPNQALARAKYLRGGKLVGRAGSVLTAGLSFREQWNDDSGKKLTTEAKVARATTVAAASTGGAIVGAQAGASMGAMIGSFGGPVGIVAGGLIGGAIGGAAGSEIGKRGGRLVAGAAGRAADQVGDWAGDAKAATSKAAHKVGDAAGAAKDKAGDAAHAAKDKAGDAAHAAKDKAGDVAHAAKDKADDVADAAKDKAKDGAKSAGKAAKKVAGWANPFG